MVQVNIVGHRWIWHSASVLSGPCWIPKTPTKKAPMGWQCCQYLFSGSVKAMVSLIQHLKMWSRATMTRDRLINDKPITSIDYMPNRRRRGCYQVVAGVKGADKAAQVVTVGTGAKASPQWVRVPAFSKLLMENLGINHPSAVTEMKAF